MPETTLSHPRTRFADGIVVRVTALSGRSKDVSAPRTGLASGELSPKQARLLQTQSPSWLPFTALIDDAGEKGLRRPCDRSPGNAPSVAELLMVR